MCRLLLMTVGCLSILFGITGWLMMPKLIQQKLEQRMQLRIDTKTFDRFTKVPIPLTVKFYLFNVTNSERVLLGLERPQFQEVGPFMFKQWRRREVADFEDYNRRLKYREIKTFYPMFEPAASTNIPSSTGRSSKLNNSNISRHDSDKNYSNIANNNNNNKHISDKTNNNNNNNNDNDNISKQTQQPFMLDPHNTNVTIVNIPLLAVLTKLAQLEEGSFKRNVAAKVATRLIRDGRDKILITRPVNQLLFDGYKVDFMESARDLVSGTLGFNFDSPLPKNTFGFFYMKNNTWTRKDNGMLTVFTGRNESMNDFMMIESFNDLKELNVWPKNTVAGNRCNQIKGTDGSQFHPGVTRSQVLSIFSPLVCRSLYIKYKEDTSARDIPLLRFSTPAELFGAPKKSPQNACYCTIQPAKSTQSSSLTSTSLQSSSTQSAIGSNQTVGPTTTTRITDSRCYLDGLMDLSLCQRGAPIAASSPHFYNADPMLAMAAGLKPRRELHETYIDIEPMTGSVFRAASRAQINAYVEQAALEVVDSSIIGNMTPMIAPLLWLEEAAEIDEKSSLEFKDKLLNLVQKAKRSFIYSIIFGLILVIVVSLQYWYVTCYGIDTDELRRRNKNKRIDGACRRANMRRSEGKASGAKQLEANLRLGGGARSSNLSYLKKKVKSGEENIGPDESERENIGLEEKLVSSTAGKACPAVIGIAAALGADAIREKNRRGARKSQDRVGSRKEYQAGEGDEEELSKRMLVADEWEPAAATTSSSGRSSQGADNQATRAGEEEDDHHHHDDEVENDAVDEQTRLALDEKESDLMRPSTSFN